MFEDIVIDVYGTLVLAALNNTFGKLGALLFKRAGFSVLGAIGFKKTACLIGFFFFVVRVVRVVRVAAAIGIVGVDRFVGSSTQLLLKGIVFQGALF